ncbi:spore germination protein [Desulfosporosinus sp. SB140]|uniref:spore germination protein n=1 Tax=Desulfosporosinus paludis TaxID=3115649 RepID=UPI003890DB08
MLTKIISKSKRRSHRQLSETLSQSSPLNAQTSLSKNLSENLQSIQKIFENASDLVIREFKIGAEQPVHAFAVMIFGLFDEASVNENLIKPLMSLRQTISKEFAVDVVRESVLPIASIQEYRTLEEAVTGILSGDTALFIDGTDKVLLASIRGWDLLCQGLAPQVSLALERKADEPFATLRLMTHSPAVWILNFRVRDTKGGRAFRHTATYNADSCSVDPERVEPRCFHSSKALYRYHSNALL